jgi:hypothetical protein
MALAVVRIVAFRCDPLQLSVGKGLGKERWAGSPPICLDDRMHRDAIMMATD